MKSQHIMLENNMQLHNAAVYSICWLIIMKNHNEYLGASFIAFLL